MGSSVATATRKPEVTEVKRQNEQLKTEIQALRRLEEQPSAAAEHSAEQEVRMTELQQTNDWLRKQLGVYKAEVTELGKRVDKLIMPADTGQVQEEVRTLRQQMRDMTERLTAAVNEKAQMATDMQALKAEHDSLKDQLLRIHVLQPTNNRLHERLHACETERNKLQTVVARTMAAHHVGGGDGCC